MGRRRDYNHVPEKKARIEHLYAVADREITPEDGDPAVVFRVDEFGPLNLQPRPGRQWAAVSGNRKEPAEAIRVPQAQGTLVKLSVAEDAALLPSLLTMSDVLATGHDCAVKAGIRPGTSPDGGARRAAGGPGGPVGAGDGRSPLRRAAATGTDWGPHASGARQRRRPPNVECGDHMAPPMLRSRRATIAAFSGSSRRR